MNHLRAERHKLHMSQTELARRAKVSARTICSIEAGTKPRHETMRRILKALGARWDQRWLIFPP